MYPVDYWFWLLNFAIPYGFSCRMDVIETFDAVFFDKTVYDPTNANNNLWSDPFATFIHVACKFRITHNLRHDELIMSLRLGELLIPYTPFGGFGAGQSIRFWDHNLSRNQIIHVIVTVVTGVKYSIKTISQHKRAITKDLLNRYVDEAVEPYVREYAGVALQRFAGTTRLSDYLASYLEATPPSPSHKSKGRYLTLVFAVHQLITEHPDAPSTAVHHQDVGNLMLHPFLAFLLGINGTSPETTRFASYFECATYRTPALRDFGRKWWDNYVMSDTERKHGYARLWANNVGDQNMHDMAFYHKFGPPPASDGGPFWGRYTPFTHLHREDCGHPKLYKGPTVFYGQPNDPSMAEESAL